MKYSIITINFNNRDGLQKTIDSVVNQTYKDFEYIIIDGGSTDGSVDIIREYADRIDYWVSEPDKGIYNAMNKGILKAHGEYINFMNSGDCFNNECVLADAAPIIKADICIGRYHEGDCKNEWYYPYKEVTLFHLHRGALCHQASFFKKHLFDKDAYRENLRIVSDWEFYIRKLIIEGCSFQSLNICIAIDEPNGISNTQQELNIDERKIILKEKIPQRILLDYNRLLNIGYELWDVLPSIPIGYRYQHLLCKVIIRSIKVLNVIDKFIPLKNKFNWQCENH